ncbi:unnamed protein product, partial [Mesorhabditis spiculigera]
MDERKRTLILTNAVLSFFTNLVLLYFIARHSRRHISGYKFLLAIFALFNICFAVTQATVLPAFHVYRYGWILFPTGKLFAGSPEWGFWSCAAYCMMYNLCLVLLTYHFVYRFVLICREESHHHLRSRPICILLFIGWLLNGVLWGVVCRVTMYQWKETRDYMQFSLLNEYGLDSAATPMLGPIYFFDNPDGTRRTNWLSCLGSFYCVSLMTGCFSTILYCSRKIDAVLWKSRMSERARRLQKDLFKALLIQLIVPGISKFLPGTCMFTFPLFGLNTGKLANYAAVLASFNTVLEPIFLLYFVKDYRYAILRLAGKRDSSGTYYISETGEKIERSLTYSQKPMSPRTATML